MASSVPADIMGDWVCAMCTTECGVLQTMACGHVLCPACLHNLNDMDDGKCSLCKIDESMCDLDVYIPVIGSSSDFGETTSDYGTMTRDSVIKCDLCGELDAQHMCQTCVKNLCDGCRDSHMSGKPSNDHVIIQRNETTVCFKHHHLLKTLFCQTCTLAICEICFDESHDSHKVVTKTAYIGEKRQQLLSFKDASLKIHKAASELDFENAVKTLDESYSEAKQKVGKAQEKLNAEFDEIKLELQKQHAKECGEIKLFENKMDDCANMLKIHMNTVDKTLTGGRETDILAVAEQLASMDVGAPEDVPEYSKPVINTEEIEHFTLKNVLTFEKKKFEVGKRENNNAKSKSEESEPGKNGDKKKCEKLWTNQINFPTGAVIHDANSSVFWVRTADPEGRLWKYSETGEFLGKYLHTTEELGGICCDTKRHLLLVIQCPNIILTLDENGAEASRIVVSGAKYFAGIVYIPDKDWYGLSDYDKNCLWFVDAESRQPVKQIGTKRSAQGLFVEPTFLSYGVAVGNSTPSLYVIDRSVHHLKEFALDGTVLNRYAMGGKDKYLLHPLGICLDASGKLLICDRDKGRIGRFFQRGENKLWRVILNRGQVDGMTPIGVCVTPNGKLAVTAAKFNCDYKIQPPCYLYMFSYNF